MVRGVLVLQIIVGVSVDAYAIVGIMTSSEKRRSDNQRLGKRRSATQA